MRAGSAAAGLLTEILRSAPGEQAPSWGEAFCSALQAVVQADLVSLNGMSPDRSLVWAVDSPAGTCHGDTVDALARLSATHPGVRWGSRHLGLAVRLTDLQPWSLFRRTELYADIYRPLGLRHEIDLVAATVSGPVTVAVQRTRRDFDDGATELLTLLGPVLAMASLTLWMKFQVSTMALPPGGPPGLSRLTPRERQVLSLLAQGARDADIAGQCGISPATAKKHVEHILAKLGARSRSAAVAAGFRDSLAL